MSKHLPAVAAASWILFVGVATVMPLDAFVGGPFEWVLINDWAAHVVLFGVLAVLAVAYQRPDGLRAAVWTFAGGLAFGGLIEVVQAALPWERGAEWSDLAADGVGLLLGLAAYAVWARLRRRATPARR